MNYVNEIYVIMDTKANHKIFCSVNNIYCSRMKEFPASTKFHHCEAGGYIRHVYEVIRFCEHINFDFEKGGTLVEPDALIKVAFIHDLDKLERYELDPEKPTNAQVKYATGLRIKVTFEDSKSSLSTKIDNAVNGTDKPIQYYRYRELLPVDESADVVRICFELGIKLSREEIHCLAVHHGGWSDAGKRGTMSPMATILHCADLMSAKVLG